MNDLEALMWTLEKDPYLSSAFANLTTLDRAPDMARLRRRLEHASVVLPRLRQRVRPALGRLAPPAWQDDPEFELGYHLRRIALPQPASERELLDLATRLAHTPFDRTRPLWEFTVIEGAEDGGAAVVQKIHHAVTDGVGGVRMAEEMVDLTPEGDLREDATDDPPAVQPAEEHLLATTADTVTHRLRRLAGAAQRTARSATDLATHPDRLPEVGGEALSALQSVRRQLAVVEPAHSPLWTARSLRQRFEVLSVPFADAHRAAKAMGGSLNDLFVTAACRGAGAYHRAHGAEVEELRMAMPVSTRHDRTAGGNAFAPSRVLVPVSIDDPVEHLQVVADRLDRTRHEPALELAASLAGVMVLLPTSVLVRFARQQAATIDFTTSNVRGAPVPLYLAGARVTANYPLGPLAVTAFNLTLLSYDGSLDMGLMVDEAAVEDPASLRSSIEEGFRELLASAG